MLKGIDISTWQKPSSINYDALAKEVDFVILRVGYTGYGTNPPYSNNFNKDDTFETHYAEFIKRGVPVGVYWYGGATSTAEVDKEIAVMMAAIKGKKLEYPVYYDVEENRNQGTLSKAALTAIVKDWCAKVEAQGYYVGIYASLSWTNSKFDYGSISNFDLWLAHWGVDKPGRSCDMWQYTSDGSLNGHSGRLDMNIAYRDFKKIITEGGLNHLGETPTPPTPPVEPEKPSGTYKVGDVVTVNGQLFRDSAGNRPGATIKNHKGTITYTAIGNAKPYHIDGLGWVAESSINGAAPTPSPLKVGDRVKYSGRLYRDSNGNGAGTTVSGTYTVTTLNGNPYGAHLDGLGWVKLGDLVKV